MKTDQGKHSIRTRTVQAAAVILLIFMGINTGMNMDMWYVLLFKSEGSFASHFRAAVPLSVLPGPKRDEPLVFELNEDNSIRMAGRNDPEFERWSDILGNYYSTRFIRAFDYEKTPVIRLKYEKKGGTLKGRLEARGLKPNFAYQLKLLGDYKDKVAFEAIGQVGRWRLPGLETNYTYEDYINSQESTKAKSEAYVFFDFFVTDAKGNAVRNFAMDSSLHVLWKDSQRKNGVIPADTVKVAVKANDGDVYSRPKQDAMEVNLWAEREKSRYRKADETILLPAGKYQAFMILTEESFHSHDNDGGWWATVAKEPISFEIISTNASN